MPRNMSFALTKDQVRRKEKDVTRRMGWWFLKPGEIVNPVEKCQGLKKGEKVKRVGDSRIRILSTRGEPLNTITPDDVRREGFPDWTPGQFVEMFAEHNRCEPDEEVNRIEFEYL